MSGYPRLMHTVLDATDSKTLAEFYRRLLGLHYREGDEEDWMVLLDSDGRRVITIQRVPRLDRPTWPSHDVSAQMHLDFRVDTAEELERHRRRAEELGASLLLDRFDDADEPLYVFADPAGHPFCIMVSQG
ncbi:glyoxalase [Paractinoplanes abujensis]|uniref:Catechol-2,3-dioxygenase n=1 Tax=Paractinoplanes abujensis TaxID=882441 RepID=A0A7W7G2E0_9ACTN|nr:VOC family protein [Actinoplanes abujensis]MBB4693682.1 catechol-2,3-dioxygenase [Actinoplanes abujensis]GID21661.1 glyoxalase [Actinoplanes abujensis]